MFSLEVLTNIICLIGHYGCFYYLIVIAKNWLPKVFTIIILSCEGNCLSVCVCVYVCMCMHVCVCSCVCVCVCCVFVCVHAYISQYKLIIIEYILMYGYFFRWVLVIVTSIILRMTIFLVSQVATPINTSQYLYICMWSFKWFHL